jgi:hypothetical protein
MFGVEQTIRLTFLLIATMTAVLSAAHAQVPQFRDYPAQPYAGQVAPLVLGPNDANFHTRLREAARQPANFGGAYSLATWGCGTECLMGAEVNLRTGRVVWLPSTICCWPSDADDKFQPFVFRVNSTLLVMSGLRNEKEGDQGAHFYRIEGDQFVFVRDIPHP